MQPRFPKEGSAIVVPQDKIATTRTFEIALALIGHAERMVPRSDADKEPRFKFEEMVLLRRGYPPSGPKIDQHFWLGPSKIIAANHPHYIL